MNDLKFSVIIVCLNAGARLKTTVDSVLRQSYGNYEIVLKDGGSTDGSVEELLKAVGDDRLHVYRKEDGGIYDAMNEAVELAEGDYFIFLNAGDRFYDEDVLDKISGEILNAGKNGETPDIVYGNLYHKALSTMIHAAPEMNPFTCYRNVPCHQTCFYSYRMFAERAYLPKYNVRADYEHFLWCFFEKKAVVRYAPVTVAVYEGGGYSETPENKRLSQKQHAEIALHYIGKKKVRKYRLLMLLSLAPLRSAIADSKRLSVFYNKIKDVIYSVKKSGTGVPD